LTFNKNFISSQWAGLFEVETEVLCKTLMNVSFQLANKGK